MSDIQGVDTTPPSRRSLVKGAAWAVPAVVVAAAAPTVAASVPCLTATFDATSCKQPGNGNNFGYKLKICFVNSCTTPITITVTSVQANTGNAVLLPVNQGSITVGANSTACLPDFVYYCSSNSANYINVSYTIQGQPGTQVAQVPSPVQVCVNEPQFCN